MEKKIVLCDTNILVEFFKNDKKIRSKLKSIGREFIFISTITAAELYYGAFDRKELITIKNKLKSITQIPINEDINDIFEALMLKYVLSHKLSIPDAIIAATALYYDLPLYTLNKKDFKYISGLNLY